jgi:23S rRNA pseudouridine955/2504/2580 synthase
MKDNQLLSINNVLVKNEKFIDFTVNAKEISLRKWFLNTFINLPQSVFFSSLRKKDIQVNGISSNLNASYTLKANDVVSVYRSIVNKNNCTITSDEENEKNRIFNISLIKKVANQLKILHENENFIVIDKPYGVASQLGTRVLFSLIEVLDYLCSCKIYPVHRLDKNTTGVMIFAKNYDWAVKLSQLFESNVYKEYTLLVHGKFPDSLILNKKIGRIYSSTGDRMVVVNDERSSNCSKDSADPFSSFHISNIQDSCTEFTLLRVLEKNGKYYSELKAILHTGRKHQIRVHCDYLGHSIVGDEKYNNVCIKNYHIDRESLLRTNHSSNPRCRNCHCGNRMMLHCSTIEFENFKFSSSITFRL